MKMILELELTVMNKNQFKLFALKGRVLKYFSNYIDNPALPYNGQFT